MHRPIEFEVKFYLEYRVLISFMCFVGSKSRFGSSIGIYWIASQVLKKNPVNSPTMFFKLVNSIDLFWTFDKENESISFCYFFSLYKCWGVCYIIVLKQLLHFILFLHLKRKKISYCWSFSRCAMYLVILYKII